MHSAVLELALVFKIPKYCQQRTQQQDKGRVNEDLVVYIAGGTGVQHWTKILLIMQWQLKN